MNVDRVLWQVPVGPSVEPTQLDNIKNIADILGTCTTASAVIIGGAWVYFKFMRGRTFARRAELDIGCWFDRPLYLRVVVTLKNVGLSKLPLNNKRKAIRLFGAIQTDSDDVSRIEWQRISTGPLLEQHDWLESQEVVTDETLYKLPFAKKQGPDFIAYKAEAIVGAAPTKIPRKRTEWCSQKIVLLPQELEMSKDREEHTRELRDRKGQEERQKKYTKKDEAELQKELKAEEDKKKGTNGAQK